MRVWIATAIIVGTTAAIMAGLWTQRDNHWGLSNVCLPIYAGCR